jgi:hypothetical protein
MNKLVTLGVVAATAVCIAIVSGGGFATAGDAPADKNKCSEGLKQELLQKACEGGLGEAKKAMGAFVSEVNKKKEGQAKVKCKDCHKDAPKSFQHNDQADDEFQKAIKLIGEEKYKTLVTKFTKKAKS